MTPTSTFLRPLAAALLLASLAAPAYAEKADREKPIFPKGQGASKHW